MSGQHKTTLVETVPPPRLGLNTPGLKHMLLAFRNASLASVIFGAPHFSLIAFGRTRPYTSFLGCRLQ